MIAILFVLFMGALNVIFGAFVASDSVSWLNWFSAGVSTGVATCMIINRVMQR